MTVKSEIRQRRLSTALPHEVKRRKRRQHDAPAHVMVVEDSPDIRNLMRFMLESSGLLVTTASDGRSGTELIDFMKQAPDLIVLDRMLPYVSGDTLLHRIRSKSLWDSVPIVVVSAKSGGIDIACSLGAGANDYITKPFSTLHFLEVVHRFI